MPKDPGAAQFTQSEQELRKSYDALVQQQKQSTRDRALNSLIKSFGWIVIPFPVFLYYQKKLRDNPVG